MTTAEAISDIRYHAGRIAEHAAHQAKALDVIVEMSIEADQMRTLLQHFLDHHDGVLHGDMLEHVVKRAREILSK